MPFKSQAQRRKFYAMADRGEISKETVKKWEKHTVDKKLPERVKQAFLDELGAILGTAYGWREPDLTKQALDPRIGGALVGAGVGGLAGYSAGDSPIRNTLIGAGVGGALGYGGGALFRRAQLAQESMQAGQTQRASERAAAQADRARRAGELARVKQERHAEKLNARLDEELRQKGLPTLSEISGQQGAGLKSSLPKPQILQRDAPGTFDDAFGPGAFQKLSPRSQARVQEVLQKHQQKEDAITREWERLRSATDEALEQSSQSFDKKLKDVQDLVADWRKGGKKTWEI